MRRAIVTTDQFSGLEIGFGIVTAIGSPPGRGKTALASQLMFEALANDPNVERVYFAGNDTSFSSIVNREIVRKTNIDPDAIRFNNLSAQQRELALMELQGIRQKSANLFVLEPADWVGLGGLFKLPSGLLILDYLQTFVPSDTDLRQGIGQLMRLLRALADRGWAVLALSAVKRPSTGNYADTKLDLSSFRESSEIEFAVDAAYVLKEHGSLTSDPNIRNVRLECVKNRNGALRHIDLSFNGAAMQFDDPITVDSVNPFPD